MNWKKYLIWITGIIVGLSAIILGYYGNPSNMGFCIACFQRDIAGALGLHRVGVVQYIRPEIIGIVLGAFIAAIIHREFKPQGGSSPATRFILGIFVMIGALVFLGCPLRMTIRLGGGDLNALVALIGFIAGIWLGVIFLKKGFSLKKASSVTKLDGWILPSIMIILLLLLIFAPVFNKEVGGPIFFSEKGPGSQHAPILLSIIGGLLVGYFAQRSRMCFVGGISDFILIRETYLLKAFITIFFIVLIGTLIMGNFKLGFIEQPIAHNQHIWNFLGMSLVGLGSVLLGGCPLRQLIIAGTGNSDSTLTVLGMIIGAAIAHNFMLTASPKGVSIYGQIVVILGLVIAILIGFLNREK
ncbi:MAG: YedE-related selenium metabolism membrane protein [Actinobacteria bacterium]|nr:YedE-related selenium metabolism membrane protein [Actinomycetota bacterium]